MNSGSSRRSAGGRMIARVAWGLWGVAAVGAGLVPARAGAQGAQGAASAQAPRPAAQRLEGRLDATTRDAVLALVDSADRVGLPVEPLVDKALEGASKRAPGPRIVFALRTLVGELGLARQTLGGTASEQEIAAAAGALHIGVRPAELTRLRVARGRQPLTVALGVLSDLVARGVPTDTATTAVLTLAEAHIDDDDLVEFRRSVERDIALGAPPSAAAAVRVGGIASPSDAFTEQGNLAGDARSGPARPRRP
jgi:hypothetical protein